MTKMLTVKIENEVVTMVLDTLTERAMNAEIGKLQHKKYLLEKKKQASDMSSMRLAKEITIICQQILALSSEEAKKLIKEAQDKKEFELLKRHIAQLNAETIMLEFFGQEAHDRFMEQREFCFTDDKAQSWKITTEGTVFKQVEDNKWEPKCLIRPHELPMPDFIIAAITSVRNQPDQYQNRARGR